MFFFLRQDLFREAGIIEIDGHTQTTSEFSWTAGSRFDRPIPRETLMLDPAYGTLLPDFFDTTIPVMSNRLIDALRQVEIDNLDVYSVLLKRIDTGDEIQGYSAINIIGSVDAVDLSNSEYRLRFGKPYFTGRVTIDTTKTLGLKAFRLAKGPGFIVIEERSAKFIQSHGFRAVLLQPTVEYRGT